MKRAAYRNPLVRGEMQHTTMIGALQSNDVAICCPVRAMSLHSLLLQGSCHVGQPHHHDGCAGCRNDLYIVSGNMSIDDVFPYLVPVREVPYCERWGSTRVCVAPTASVTGQELVGDSLEMTGLSTLLVAHDTRYVDSCRR